MGVVTTLKDFTELAKLHEYQARLEDELKHVKDLINEREELLLQVAQEEGLQNIRVSFTDENGNQKQRTIYIQRQVWAYANGDRSATVEALKQAGLQDYVSETFNTSSLSAFIREFDPDRNKSPDEIMKELPEELQGKIKIVEKLKLKSRPSS